MRPIRLFILCKPGEMRRGLSAIFIAQSSFDIVGEGGTDAGCIAKVQKVQPDAVLYKVSSSKECQKQIKALKELCPRTKLLAILDNGNRGMAKAAMAAGADCCLTRTMSPCYLVEAVELTCRAGLICFPVSLKPLVTGQDELSKTPNPDSGPVRLSYQSEDDPAKLKKISLTAREIEVYKLIIRNYSNKEIGKQLFISQSTVKKHVSNILRKLELINRVQLIFFEMKNKYYGEGVKNEGQLALSKKD